MAHKSLLIPIRLELTAAFYVRQDVPTPPVPRCQHNTLLRQAPRLLQTYFITRECPAHCTQPDRDAQTGNIAIFAGLGNNGSRGGGLATL
jgi:hypothetical protein